MTPAPPHTQGDSLVQVIIYLTPQATQPLLRYFPHSDDWATDTDGSELPSALQVTVMGENFQQDHHNHDLSYSYTSLLNILEHRNSASVRKYAHVLI